MRMLKRGKAKLKKNNNDVSAAAAICFGDRLKLTFSIGKFMQLPMNRIRTIINLDEDSQMISKEALVLITKATELFVQDFGGVCAQIAKC